MVGATAAGLVAILSFHSRSGSFASTVGKGATTTSPSAHPTTATTSPAQHSTTSPSSPHSGPVTSTPPTTGGGSAAARTAVGKMENYGYGHLDVRATVHGGKLTDVKVLTLQTAEPYSQQLAVQVLPMLRSQAEKVQSAKISGVSGATYTSEAYALSLQSALDRLHFH